MAKKKNRKHSHPKRPAIRNAAPPRAPRAPRASEETTLTRLAYTAGGAGAAALAVSLLQREGWAPKTIATAIGASGAALAWKAGDPAMRAVGAGAASAAGAQLALLVMEDHDAKASSTDSATAQNTATPPTTAAQQRLANAAQALPSGALESALARAQARLALSDGAGGAD